ncbi:MAG TPA: TolC family protein, partial [Myxococcota bacterium]|nr:TolC family protein [Myxococcota bacterium]
MTPVRISTPLRLIAVAGLILALTSGFHAVASAQQAEPAAVPTATSMTLAEVLDLAMEQNPRILKARQGIAEAEAELETARAEYHPRVEFQFLLAPMTGHHVPDPDAPFTSVYSNDLGDLGEWGIWTKIG